MHDEDGPAGLHPQNDGDPGLVRRVAGRRERLELVAQLSAALDRGGWSGHFQAERVGPAHERLRRWAVDGADEAGAELVPILSGVFRGCGPEPREEPERWLERRREDLLQLFARCESEGLLAPGPALVLQSALLMWAARAQGELFRQRQAADVAQRLAQCAAEGMLTAEALRLARACLLVWAQDVEDITGLTLQGIGRSAVVLSEEERRG